MADISVTEKQGGNRTWILAVIAVVLVVGLMIWLENQEGTTALAPTVVEEDTAAAVAGDTLAPGDTAADTAAADTAAP